MAVIGGRYWELDIGRVDWVIAEEPAADGGKYCSSGNGNVGSRILGSAERGCRAAGRFKLHLRGGKKEEQRAVGAERGVL